MPAHAQHEKYGGDLEQLGIRFHLSAVVSTGVVLL